MHRGGSRDHGEPIGREVRQAANHLLRHAVAEVLLVRIAAEILERQRRQAELAAAGRFGRGCGRFFLLGFWTNNRVNLIIFLIPLLAASFVLIRNLFRQSQKAIFTIFIFSWFWIPFLLMYVISFWIPIFLDRYLIYISPAFFLILPLSLTILKIKPILKKTILSVFIILMVISFKFNISNEREFDKIAAKIKELKKQATEIYFCPPWFDLNTMYYCDPYIFKHPYQLNSLMAQKRYIPLYNYEGLHQETLDDRLPLVYIDCNSKYAFSGNTILEVLLKRYKSSEKFEFASGFSIYYFHE